MRISRKSTAIVNRKAMKSDAAKLAHIPFMPINFGSKNKKGTRNTTCLTTVIIIDMAGRFTD